MFLFPLSIIEYILCLHYVLSASPLHRPRPALEYWRHGCSERENQHYSEDNISGVTFSGYCVVLGRYSSHTLLKWFFCVLRPMVVEWVIESPKSEMPSIKIMKCIVTWVTVFCFPHCSMAVVYFEMMIVPGQALSGGGKEGTVLM